MRTFMTYVLPTMTVGFSCVLPASVQLSFTASTALSLLQMHYLRQNRVREYLGIHPFPSANSPSVSPYKGTITVRATVTPTIEQPPAPKGIIGGAISDIKGAASQVMKRARSLQEGKDEKIGSQRLTQAEFKRAHAYEAQRRREIAQEKLEAETARSGRRQRSVR